MIALKKGLCPVCDDGVQKGLIAGVCQIHYWSMLRSETGVPSRKGPISRAGFQPPTDEQIEQEAWYDLRIKGMTGRCWECKDIIVTSNRKFAKAAIAHILAVEHFPSIATHELNFLELGGACGCHNRWDRTWTKAEGMTVFSLAVSRFKQFYPAIALAERKKIPEIFLTKL